MHLGMSLRMSQEQSITQRLEMAQRVALLQSTLQQMTATIALLRAETPGSFKECVPNVLARVLECGKRQIRQAEVLTAMQSLFETGTFQATVNDEVWNLSSATRQSLDFFAVRLLEQTLQKNSAGKLLIPRGLKEEDLHAINMDSTVVRYFRDAFLQPQKLQQDLDGMKELAQTSGGNGLNTGAVQDIGEINIALRAHKLMGAHYHTCRSLVKLALSISDGGEPLFMNFLRDFVVMSKLDYVLSLRIQRRFAARFEQAGPKARKKNYRDAMLNSIGEFVLVSLGIIAPSVFALKSAEIDEVGYLFAEQNFDDMDDEEENQTPADVELSKWMKQYRLQTKGRIFWNRWAMVGRQPTAFTDESIRSFIRQTVAKCTDELLEAVDFDDVFRRCQDVNAEARESEDDDDEATEALLGEVLADAFDSTKFREILQCHMRGDWYRELKVFWNEQTPAHE